jgi:hypothetical protein
VKKVKPSIDMPEHPDAATVGTKALSLKKKKKVKKATTFMDETDGEVNSFCPST